MYVSPQLCGQPRKNGSRSYWTRDFTNRVMWNSVWDITLGNSGVRRLDKRAFKLESNRRVKGIKEWSLLSFIGGVAVTLGFSNIGGSKNSQRVYELRLYHVNEGKIDALIARFGDHTDAILKRHNMNSIGF